MARILNQDGSEVIPDTSSPTKADPFDNPLFRYFHPLNATYTAGDVLNTAAGVARKLPPIAWLGIGFFAVFYLTRK